MRIGEVQRNQRVLSTVVRAYVCMHKAFCTAASQGEAFDQHIASRLTVTRSGARGPGLLGWLHLLGQVIWVQTLRGSCG